MNSSITDDDEIKSSLGSFVKFLLDIISVLDEMHTKYYQNTPINSRCD